MSSDIYWKGMEVEHYDDPEDPKMHESAWELVACCCHLEALGLTPTTKKAIWAWDWWEKLQLGNPWINFLVHLEDIYDGKARMGLPTD